MVLNQRSPPAISITDALIDGLEDLKNVGVARPVDCWWADDHRIRQDRTHDALTFEFGLAVMGGRMRFGVFGEREWRRDRAPSQRAN